MISPAGIYALAGVVYLLALGALLVRFRGVPSDLRRLLGLVPVVIGTGAVTSFLMAAGIGSVQFAGEVIDLPSLLNDLVAYPLLWYVAAMLGGVRGRVRAVIVGLPVAQVLAFQLGAAAGGLLGLSSSLSVIVGHFVLVYLFVGPIWRQAQGLADERRLLHWKARNLLLFLIGMLIAYAFLGLAGAFTALGSLVIHQYIAVLIRVGFAGFLFANLEAVGGDETGLGAVRAGTDGVAAEAD